MIQTTPVQQVPIRQIPLTTSTSLQKGLFILTVACGALSLIPGLRTAGSLATRSATFLTSSANCAKRWSHEDTLSRINKCTKIATVTLGIAGIVISSPLFITASLAIDLAIQLLETAKSLYHRENTILLHLGIIAVDTFALAGIVLESAPFMLIAAVISCVAMLYFAANAFMQNELGEGFGYIALSLISCVSAIEITGLTKSVPTTSYFTVKNTYQDEISFQDVSGSVVAIAKPDETVTFSVPTVNTFTDVELFPTAFPSFPVFMRVRGYKIMASVMGEGNFIRYFNHSRTDYQSRVILSAIQPNDYASLPLSTTVISTKDTT